MDILIKKKGARKWVKVKDLQLSRALVVSATKRVDIPLVVGTVGFLDVSAHQVFLNA